MTPGVEMREGYEGVLGFSGIAIWDIFTCACVFNIFGLRCYHLAAACKLSFSSVYFFLTWFFLFFSLSVIALI
jgi:hypothetical protein